MQVNKGVSTLPSNGNERLSTLHDSNILDTPFEPLLDSITRLAATNMWNANRFVDACG